MDAANQLSDIPNDLASCEREPLHFIGSIQSIGALIAFTVDDRRIQAASENIEKFLGIKHQEVLTEKLDHILDAVVAQKAVGLINELSITRNRANFVFQRNGERFDAAVFVTDGIAFLEFEPSSPPEDYSDLINQTFIGLRSGRSLADLSGAVCQAVHRITGMDRVMMYRFLAPYDHGEVIAEHRVLSAHSYNHHRFPASDIPKTARDLYLRNQVRQIPDIDLPVSRVTPAKNPVNGKDLNLSDSRLRAVSPIHLEYLRNMKVQCSFSVAIIVDNRLWALIACHHLSEKRIPAAQRTACEMIANAFAGQAKLIEDSERADSKLKFLASLSSILEGLLTSVGDDSGLVRQNQMLFETFRATGVAIVKGAAVDFAGLCPTRVDLQKYSARFLQKMNELHVDVIATESLSDDFPDLPQLPRLACGTLGVRISDDSVAFLFRPEQIETITWGGDPRKQLDRKQLGGRINPRASFETWEETVGNRSLPWLDFEVEGFVRLKELIFEKIQRPL